MKAVALGKRPTMPPPQGSDRNDRLRDYAMRMVNVTFSLPEDLASRAAEIAADRGVTVEELASEALGAYLDHERVSGKAGLSFVALGDAANGFSARAAEARLEAEGFEPSPSS